MVSLCFEEKHLHYGDGPAKRHPIVHNHSAIYKANSLIIAFAIQVTSMLLTFKNKEQYRTADSRLSLYLKSPVLYNKFIKYSLPTMKCTIVYIPFDKIAFDKTHLMQRMNGHLRFV